MTRISDEELARALAENIDAEGNDVGLATWVSSWAPEQRSRSEENARAWAKAARHALSRSPRGPTNG